MYAGVMFDRGKLLSKRRLLSQDGGAMRVMAILWPTESFWETEQAFDETLSKGMFLGRHCPAI